MFNAKHDIASPRHSQCFLLPMEMLLQRLADRYRTEAKELPPSAMRRLEEHAWPGNVLERSSCLPKDQ